MYRLLIVFSFLCACFSAHVHDLWVVGAGHLGHLIVAEWMKTHPNSNRLSVVAESRSNRKWHSNPKVEGVSYRLRQDRSVEAKAKNVIVCFSPSISNFMEELDSASDIYCESAGGKLLYTSSTGVYEGFNGTATESSVLPLPSDRSRRLFNGEQVIRRRGGSVVRLAGLYSARRGAHAVWLLSSEQRAARSHDKQPATTHRQANACPATEPITLNKDGVINLIHYEDAANLCVSILDASTPLADSSHDHDDSGGLLQVEKGVTYLGCDSHPLTREEICKSAHDSAIFGSAAVLPNFMSMGSDTGDKKITYDNTFTCQHVNRSMPMEMIDHPWNGAVKGCSDGNRYGTRTPVPWRPKYSSLVKFFDTVKNDVQGVHPV